MEELWVVNEDYENVDTLPSQRPQSPGAQRRETSFVAEDIRLLWDWWWVAT